MVCRFSFLLIRNAKYTWLSEEFSDNHLVGLASCYTEKYPVSIPLKLRVIVLVLITISESFRNIR